MIDSTKCPTCGVDIYMTTERYASLRKTGNTFYCPNGHNLSYRPTPIEREIERLKRELDAAKVLAASRAPVPRKCSLCGKSGHDRRRCGL